MMIFIENIIMNRKEKIEFLTPIVKNLYDQGLSNRQIIKELNGHKYTIVKILSSLKLIPNGKYVKISLIDEHNAKCKKCNFIKNIDEFQIQRKGTIYENRMAYCRTCRAKQLNNAINKDIKKYIRNLFNRIKRDRLSKNIIFEITFDEFFIEYEKSNNKCFYTDKEFTLLSYGLNRRGKRERMSVDRIIPQLGYIKENIVFCLTQINSIKNDCTLVEIKEWMPSFYKRIYEKIKTNDIFKSFLI